MLGEELIRSYIKEVTESGCWRPRIVVNSQGYASIYINGKLQKLHRVSAHVFLGYDLNSTAIQVNHKNICHNRWCFNFEHLYIGTQSQNIHDAVNTSTHYQARKFVCKYGHSFTLGKRQRYCLTCVKIYQQKKKEEKEKQQSAVS